MMMRAIVSSEAHRVPLPWYFFGLASTPTSFARPWLGRLRQVLQFSVRYSWRLDALLQTPRTRDEAAEALPRGTKVAPRCEPPARRTRRAVATTHARDAARIG